MFPHLYVIGEDSSFVLVGLIAIAVFAAPVLVVPITEAGPRRRLRLGGVAVFVARVVVQVHPIPGWLAIAATALAVAGLALAVVALRPHAGRLAVGIVLGLALDTAVRAPYRSWDLAWQTGDYGVLALFGGVVAAALLAVTRAADRPPGPERGRGGVGAIGPYLMLQLLFLQNLGYVGSQAGVGFAVAVLVVLAGDALALVAIVALESRAPSRTTVGVATVLAAAAAWSLTVVDGPAVVALVLLSQVLVTGCLRLASEPSTRPVSDRAAAAGILGTSLSFVVLVLLWQLDIDTPLPVPREALPVLAAGSIGGIALRRARARPVPRSVSSIGLVAASGVAVIALALAGWLWWDRPSAGAVELQGDEIRVVQYNIRGSLGIDGQLDPDAVARAIASSHPDVVVLQEVARGWPIFGAGDILARLQQRLDLPYRYEPAADGQFGNVIMSRLPMDPVSSGPLPAGDPDAQTRSYLAVRIDAGDGRTVLVVAGHLESDDVAQIEALLDAWGGESPAIVAGDFNMQPEDVANVRRFTDAGLVDAEGATGDQCRTTSAEPTSDCDRVSWVFVTTDLRILGFRIGTETASDHLPVHVRLGLPPA
jgi:endonuclease/exonuclease/phosphatase family metal-dependent hydrolase